VEHDAGEIWDVTCRVAREAVEAANDVDIRSIGITNQRETVVLWDRETLEPLHRAIVWQDRRTAARCRELRAAGHEDDVRSRSGLVLDPYFSGTKIRWLLESRPDLLARAEAGDLAVGTMDSWLIARLTDGASHVTDPTNASRTMLYNLREATWDPVLLDLLGVPRAVLPEILPSSGDFGVALGAHLGIEATIGGVAGDQQAALFGQGIWSAGMAKNTYGTGAFLLLHTGDEPIASERGLLTTAACGPTGGLSYALEGSVFIAGAAIQWLRDGLGLLDVAAASEAMAKSLPDNQGVYFVPAFVGLGAPHWDPEARGTIVGLTRGTRREHVVRAALEAMAYGTAEVLEAMEADSGVDTKELRVDGGGSMNDWLMSFQADIIDVPVRRPPLIETTALGAAGLAGLSAGVWTSASDFVGAQGEGALFEPSMGAEERSGLVSGWDRAVRATRSWAADSA